MAVIKIGSRGSDLALWQANFVKAELEKLGHEAPITIIKTKGDAIQHLSFDKMEGKGFFTKEIEDQLLNESVDLAVHSHKDLETTSPEGLTIGAVSYRANPADVLLIRKEKVGTGKFRLTEGAVVGTSSARRKVQLKQHRPDITLKDIRGNVPTRIKKLRSGDFDAIVLAHAGISRLKLDVSDLELLELDIKEFIPAPAQGVLGLQVRSTDAAIAEAVLQLNHPLVKECIDIERGILKGCNGGCQLPLGAYAEKVGNEFHVWVSFAKTVNDSPINLHFFDTNPEKLVEKVLNKLISRP